MNKKSIKNEINLPFNSLRDYTFTSEYLFFIFLDQKK